MIYPISPDLLADEALQSARYEDLEHSYFWSDCWDPDFYIALAKAGYISISTTAPEVGTVLIAELQTHYAVLDWVDLHISQNIARLLRSGRLEDERVELTASDSCEQVLQRLLDYHGEETWLSPPYCDLLRKLPMGPGAGFRLRAIELWSRSEDRLIAGEIGYTLGRTYTSLSGFCDRSEPRWRNSGSLQIVMLARRLQEQGYAFWNMGHPHMAYKREVGAKIVPRGEFIGRWRAATRGTT